MRIILSLLCGMVAVASSAESKSDNQPASTLSNLQAAFNGESNAHARYLAFARKADAEGLRGAASLFRAAARAEEVHANNHAAVIKELGGSPTAKIETPIVKSTRYNLEAALKGETYERDQMYPAFIRQANSESNSKALRTLTLALAAEVEHAKLYAEALHNVERMRPSRDYYVCPVCGFTTFALDFESCPTTGTPKERFEKVN